jgi:hypothetical protein
LLSTLGCVFLLGLFFDREKGGEIFLHRLIFNGLNSCMFQKICIMPEARLFAAGSVQANGTATYEFGTPPLQATLFRHDTRSPYVVSVVLRENRLALPPPVRLIVPDNSPGFTVV